MTLTKFNVQKIKTLEIHYELSLIKPQKNYLEIIKN